MQAMFFCLLNFHMKKVRDGSNSIQMFTAKKARRAYIDSDNP